MLSVVHVVVRQGVCSSRDQSGASTWRKNKASERTSKREDKRHGGGEQAKDGISRLSMVTSAAAAHRDQETKAAMEDDSGVTADSVVDGLHAWSEYIVSVRIMK